MTEREPTSESRAEEGSDGPDIASTRNGDYFIRGARCLGSSEGRRIQMSTGRKKASTELRLSETTTILHHVIHLATPGLSTFLLDGGDDRPLGSDRR